MEEKEVKALETFRVLLNERKFTALRGMAQDMNVSDLAAVMEAMEDEDMLKMFRLFPKELAADVFSMLEDDSQQYIITSLSASEAGVIIDNLYADDATDLLEEMPANVVNRILANAKPETRNDINHLLKYPEDSAGSLMTVEFVDLRADMTVKQAISRIRAIGTDSETINICYVMNKGRTLVGTVALRKLLLKREDEVVGDFMHEDVVACRTDTDQEKVANVFKKYGFTALPVVDKEDRMVGIITVDDIMEIMDDEVTEDIDKMNAVIPNDKPYLRTGVFESWKSRIPWMLGMLLVASVSGLIIMKFENLLSSYMILALYIPLLMDAGGNASTQSSAEIVRGLSLSEISEKDMGKVVRKEAVSGLLIGLTLAVVLFGKALLLDGAGMLVALTVSVTLLIGVIFAKVLSSLLIMIAVHTKFDPAIIASPIMKTLLDAVSLVIYFLIAGLFLGA